MEGETRGVGPLTKEGPGEAKSPPPRVIEPTVIIQGSDPAKPPIVPRHNFHANSAANRAFQKKTTAIAALISAADRHRHKLVGL